MQNTSMKESLAQQKVLKLISTQKQLAIHLAV